MAQVVSWGDSEFLTALLVTDGPYAPLLSKRNQGNSLEMCWLFLPTAVAPGGRLHPSTWGFFKCFFVVCMFFYYS